MRASVVKGNVEALERFGPEVAAQIRGFVRPGILEDIANASRIAWLPLEHDIALTTAVDRIVGRRKLLDWARSSISQAVDSPLLRPVFQAAFRLFGMSPGALLRVAPSAWQAVYRDVGKVRHRGGPESAYIEIVELAEALVADRCYLEAMGESFASVFDAVRAPGTVEIDDFDAKERRIVYLARWGSAVK